MNKILLAIDFDGTLCYNAYPALGKPKPNVSDFMKRLVAEGCEIIIWTCRHGDDIPKVKEWLKEHNIPYHHINEHHPSAIHMYGNDTRKISADIYIDDKGLGGLPDDWFEVYQLIKRHIRELCTNKHFDEYDKYKTNRGAEKAEQRIDPDFIEQGKRLW